MNRLRHGRYRRMLPLQVYGELTAEERKDLERHLSGCGSCRREMNDTRKLHDLLARLPRVESSEADLRDARLQFRAALASERQRPGIVRKLSGALAALVPLRPGVLAGGLALAVAGFFAGRFAFPAAGNEGQDTSGMIGSDVRVTNFHLIGSAATDGKVDIAFDAVKPVRVRGSLKDPAIQKILAYAVVNGDNPGVRLRAAGSVAAMEMAPPEREVKAALMLAMTSDKNDGVRQEALRALLRYPGDRELRDALLSVLLHDVNPGLRVAAINALDTLQTRGFRPDERQLRTMRDIQQNDQSLYVRTKAQSILGEKIP